MRNKYGPLCDYLKRCGKSSVRLTFQEIEDIIGDKLPMSAYKYYAWWGNRKLTKHSQVKAYMEAGYQVDSFNLVEKWVIFIRE